MPPSNWKKCRQCGRKQSVRHKSDYCGSCDAHRRRKARQEARNSGNPLT